jgi:hypothetical protein
MTGFLPEAMRLNVRAMKAAGQPQEKIRPFVQSMRKRFPNMPLDRELEALLPQPGTERR